MSRNSDKASEKVQVCFQIDKELHERMEKVREETGVPISLQLQLKLKGYEISKAKE